MNIRVIKHCNTPAHRLLADGRISWGAKGLAAYLLAHPECDTSQLPNQHQVNNHLLELSLAGYLCGVSRPGPAGWPVEEHYLYTEPQEGV